MSDFSAEVELDVVVNDRQLRQVSQQIESRVGMTEMGVADGGSMSAQAARGGAGGSRERRWRRREHRWARTRTELAEDSVAYLEDIEDKVGDGGGSGILGGVLDLGGEAGGILGGALSTALATGVGSAVGTAVGESVSSTISDQALDVETEEFSVGVETEEMQDLTVDVETGELEDVNVGVQTEQLDDINVDVETDRLEAIELGVETPPPFEVRTPALPVAAPEYIPVRFPQGGGGEGEEFDRDLSQDVVDTAGFGVTTGAAAGAGTGSVGGGIGAVPGAVIGAVGGGILGAAGGALGHAGARAEHELTQSGTPPAGGSGGPVPEPETVIHGGGQSARTKQVVEQENRVRVGDVNVDAEIPYEDLDGRLDDLEDDIMDQVEDHVDDAMEELRKDVTGRR